MSSRNVTQPTFPVPPKEYDSNYMAEIVRAFSVFQQQVINPGEGRATNFTLTNLADNDTGLETGALFAQNGVVKIVRLNVPCPAGLEATATLGSVTVSIS
jgi:hypothetical protein|tara:strand:+ start:477 stop:776 length:300 start_codon:yes stop_codon:yes gene_type:complete